MAFSTENSLMLRQATTVTLGICVPVTLLFSAKCLATNIKRGQIRLLNFSLAKNMAPNDLLLTEIILKVIKFLKDDTKTLHSCILVNRLWCKITIPILWSNTFRMHKHNNKDSLLLEKQIISNYITEFSKESTTSLQIHGIILPFQRKTLFNYSTFLRHLDMNYLAVFIRSWFSSTTKLPKGTYRPDLVKVMTTILLKHLLRHSQCFISLKITNSSTTEVIIAALQDDDDPRARNCLSNLRSLKQYRKMHPVPPTFYSQLAKCAFNIEQLDVSSIGTEMSELSTLISVQRNLKELTICKKGYVSSSTEPWTGNILKPAITITHLKLNGINVPLETLYKFENLIELELKNCGYGGYDQESLTHFAKVSLKRLEIFFFETKYPIYLEPFVGLIRNSGENLKSLTLHGCQIEDPENAQKLLISLTDCSPNLIFYEGPILEDNTYELDNMLNNCTKLRELILHPSILNCFLSPSINFDYLFNTITHNKSHKLQ